MRTMLAVVLGVLCAGWGTHAGLANNRVDGADEVRPTDEVHATVRRWAPLVLLAPGERFQPSSVPYFLQHTVPVFIDNKNRSVMSMTQELPYGTDSEKYYLFTRKTVEQQLQDASSFLYGQNLQRDSIPVYATVKRCTNTKPLTKYRTWHTNSMSEINQKTSFHVTYWFFYPFNQGKNVCTVSFGVFGPVPIPKLFNKCLGEQQYIGSHVGDWEHMSLYFHDVGNPARMYVSTHDAGVYYKYDRELNVFVYERQETRKGILQKPKFPVKVYTLHGHPLLYSAKGSHGLWSKPGQHRYLTVPRMHDETGNGTPWRSWENLEIIDPPYTIVPNWMKFRGKWGNTKTYCHPLKNVGINICQLADGPTGIPMKRLNFICPN